MLAWLEHIIVAVVVIVVINTFKRHGVPGLISLLLVGLRSLPGIDNLLQKVLTSQAKTFTRAVKVENASKSRSAVPAVTLPKQGISSENLTQELQSIKEKEKGYSHLFAFVYTTHDDHFKLQQNAYDMFMEKTGITAEQDQIVKLFHHAFLHENALNPMAFPALRKFEVEVVAMTAGMLHGDSEVVGSLTSGGTESILMAMKTFRDYARVHYPHITEPEMVAPLTIHPAHEKAAHYFGFRIIHVPIKSDGRPDIVEYENAITKNTIGLLASAPQYCHGIVDPVPEISEIAVRRGLLMHVDACFGGFMLPWVEKLGYEVPMFDFRLPGVVSMTADVHKYGYGCKGASVVLFRNESIRKFQIFSYSKWPGGLFGSPTMAGSRPGAIIAASWAALRTIGEDGYIAMAKQLMEATTRLKTEISSTPGLCIVGKPNMTAFAIASSEKEFDIYALADVLEEKGWDVQRAQFPNSLHFTILPHHTKDVVDKLITDIKESAADVKAKKTTGKDGTAGVYGMIAALPNKTVVDDFLVEFFNDIYKI